MYGKNYDKSVLWSCRTVSCSDNICVGQPLELLILTFNLPSSDNLWDPFSQRL